MTDEEFKALDRPLHRGTPEWDRREHIRRRLHAHVISFGEIPSGQAHGEPDAAEQQADLTEE